MAEKKAPEPLFARLKALLGEEKAAALLKSALESRDEIELRRNLEQAFSETPNLFIVYAADILSFAKTLQPERFWIVRETEVSLDLRLDKERKLNAQSGRSIDGFLILPEDRDLRAAFRYAFQLRRTIVKARHSIIPDPQDHGVIDGLIGHLERLPLGLGVRNLVGSQRLEHIVLPELARLDEELRAKRVSFEDRRVTVRQALIEAIRYDPSQVFVSHRSSPATVEADVSERLFDRQVDEVHILGSGSVCWRLAQEVSREFVRAHPSFSLEIKEQQGNWLEGRCKIRRLSPAVAPSS